MMAYTAIHFYYYYYLADTSSTMVLPIFSCERVIIRYLGVKELYMKIADQVK